MVCSGEEVLNRDSSFQQSSRERSIFLEGIRLATSIDLFYAGNDAKKKSLPIDIVPLFERFVIDCV